MCAITGFSIGRKTRPMLFTDQFCKLLEASFARGRDGFGYQTFNSSGEPLDHGRCYSAQEFQDPDFRSALRIAIAHADVFIANHRAEPTNEFIKSKSAHDQQPYNDDRGQWFVVHNGTICNDKSLLAMQTLWHPLTTVDSAVIPFALRDFGFSRGVKEVLQGSMAIAAFHCGYPAQYRGLFLYRNYQPLYILRGSTDALVFSSLRSAGNFIDGTPVPFPPYTHVKMRMDNSSFMTSDLDHDNLTRGIVVCSGGLDSTTVATIAADECQELRILHFMYDCKAQLREIQAIHSVGAELRARHPNKKITTDFVDMKWLGRLGGSRLTDPNLEVTKGEAGVEFAHEWVPARNTAMIGIAASYADRYDCGQIYLGLNLEEASSYPDNTTEFYEEFNRVLDVGTIARPRINNPLANLMKPEIVKLAIEIGAPINSSWSCYEGGKLHCGTCGPCRLRRMAFSMIDLPDKMRYASPL